MATKNSRAYLRGVKDCLSGESLDDNPFKRDSLIKHVVRSRIEWFRGFLETRTELRIGHILDKYNKGEEDEPI